jgi:hypothetical protein
VDAPTVQWSVPTLHSSTLGCAEDQSVTSIRVAGVGLGTGQCYFKKGHDVWRTSSICHTFWSFLSAVPNSWHFVKGHSHEKVCEVIALASVLLHKIVFSDILCWH